MRTMHKVMVCPFRFNYQELQQEGELRGGHISAIMVSGGGWGGVSHVNKRTWSL